MSISIYDAKRCCLGCVNNFRQDNVKEILLSSNPRSGNISIALCDSCRRELYEMLKKEFIHEIRQELEGAHKKGYDRGMWKSLNLIKW